MRRGVKMPYVPARVRHPGRRRSRSTLPAAILLALLPLAALLQGLWMADHKDLFQPALLRLQISRVTCDHCHGSGGIRTADDPHRLLLCPVCFGRGSHEVRKQGEHEGLCPACSGMGRIPDESGSGARVCRRCDGRGVIQLEP